MSKGWPSNLAATDRCLEAVHRSRYCYSNAHSPPFRSCPEISCTRGSGCSSELLSDEVSIVFEEQAIIAVGGGDEFRFCGNFADFPRMGKQDFYAGLTRYVELVFFRFIQSENFIDHCPLRNLLGKIVSEIDFWIGSRSGLLCRFEDHTVRSNDDFLPVAVGAHLGQVIYGLVQALSSLPHGLNSVPDNLHDQVGEARPSENVANCVFKYGVLTLGER